MSEKAVWANPDDFKRSFRCTNSKFADEFLEKGSIKFNPPNSWVEHYIKNGPGRGDQFEGTIAMCHMLDVENIVKLKKMRQYNHDLIASCYDKRICLKNKERWNCHVSVFTS